MIMAMKIRSHNNYNNLKYHNQSKIYDDNYYMEIYNILS